MVPPLYERHDDSAPGPFYSVKDGCITCGLPEYHAPKNIGWAEDYEKCASCQNHCRVIRQPETTEEIEQMIQAIWGSCVGNIRYCGTDPKILKRLCALGMEQFCDALVSDIQ